MGIVRIKRVYLRIPSIGECTYTILLKTVQLVVHLIIWNIFWHQNWNWLLPCTVSSTIGGRSNDPSLNTYSATSITCKVIAELTLWSSQLRAAINKYIGSFPILHLTHKSPFIAQWTSCVFMQNWLLSCITSILDYSLIIICHPNAASFLFYLHVIKL